MLKICFITDGGGAYGLGHVQQSTAFAQELVKVAKINFITKSDSTIVRLINKCGFIVFKAKNDEQIYLSLATQDPDIIIFDKIDVSEQLVLRIKGSLKAKIVIFTNLSGANKYADIAVLADIGSSFENMHVLDKETGTRCFYGPKYWVLRPEFRGPLKRIKARPGTIRRILLIFGGSDPGNLTVKALHQTLKLDPSYKTDIILGASYPHLSELEKLLLQHPSRCGAVTVYKNIANVGEIMHQADVVVASPGLSAFEALRVGTPIIVIPHDDLQADTYRGFFKMLEREKLSELGDMLRKGDFTYPDDEKIVRMEIGDGLSELKECILGLPTTGL